MRKDPSQKKKRSAAECIHTHITRLNMAPLVQVPCANEPFVYSVDATRSGVLRVSGARTS